MFHNNLKSITSILILRLFLSNLWAQEGGERIERIIIEGNDVTQERIILQELQHELGVPFDSTTAELERRRLYNLGIFQYVDISQRKGPDNKTELVVYVTETYRFIPFPIFYYMEETGWSYGAGFSNLNFRGLNERLDMTAATGGETTYAINFSDPWIYGEQISFSARIANTFRTNRAHPFRTQIREVVIGAGKTSPSKTFGISAAFGYVKRDLIWTDIDPTASLTDTSDLQHSNIELVLSALWRTTDIWRDPTKGFQLSITYWPIIGVDEQSPNFSLMFGSAAIYRLLHDGDHPLVLALGLRVSHFNVATPIYARQYLGSTWIRGYSFRPPQEPTDRSDENYENEYAKYVMDYNEWIALLQTNNILAGGIELRQTLMPRQIWRGIEVGLQGVLFADIGWGYGPETPLSESEPLTGFGAGLRLYLPVNIMIAFDIALDQLGGGIRFHGRIGHRF